MTQREYRNQAVELILSIIKRREFLMKKGQSRIYLTQPEKEMIANFKAFRTHYNASQIAKFLIKHFDELSRIVPMKHDQTRVQLRQLKKEGESFLVQTT
jgi:hypothetical protein